MSKAKMKLYTWKSIFEIIDLCHKNSTWDEAKIDGSKLKAVINKRENGLLATGNLEIDIDPAGQFNSEMNFTAWAISIKMDINGQCIAVDESVFNQMKWSCEAILVLFFRMNS